MADQEVRRQVTFCFVPAGKVTTGKTPGCHLSDVKDVELGHHRKECSFESILTKYKLSGAATLALP
jgi:hypothetical protein